LGTPNANLRGIEPFSFLDGVFGPAVVLFFGECSFRCPYCHNQDVCQNKTPLLSFDKVRAYLKKKKTSPIEEVVISGGEPLMNSEIEMVIDEIKSLGYKTHLHTNGNHPDILKKLVGKLDYVAMDIKAPWSKYDAFSGITTDIGRVKESRDLLCSLFANHEFRTTVTADLTVEDIEKIAQEIKQGKTYYLQKFVQPEGTKMNIEPPKDAQLVEMKDVASNYIETKIR